jgi:hypothetical protein
MTADQTVEGRCALSEEHGVRILGDGLKAYWRQQL